MNGHKGLTTEILHAALKEQSVQIARLAQIILSDGSHTRSHVDKIVVGEGLAIRQQIEMGSRELLLEMQAQQSFSVEEKEKSVPRYMFLSVKQGNSSNGT